MAFKAISQIIADKSAGIRWERNGNVGPNKPVTIPFSLKKNLD
jgi:hypothetical protein